MISADTIPVPGRRRGRPPGATYDRHQRREHFLDAAERAIRKSGGNFSLTDVAQETGYARTALYALFPTKPDLLRALSHRHARYLMDRSWPVQTADLHSEQFPVFVETLIAWIAKEPALHAALDRNLTAQDRIDHGIFAALAQIAEDRFEWNDTGVEIALEIQIRIRLAIGGIAMAISWCIGSQQRIQIDHLVKIIIDKCDFKTLWDTKTQPYRQIERATSEITYESAAI